MPKPIGFTDQMFWKMCDCHMDGPVALEQADLTRPFVYERRWGVFYVPSGYHPISMSLLLAWQNDCTDPVAVANKLGLALSGETADYWLKNTDGAAFRSSVSPKIQVASLDKLTRKELWLFRDVSCVFE